MTDARLLGGPGGMTSFHMPRCIATPTHHTRCPRVALYLDGTFTCTEHRLPRAYLDVYATEATRRMLAHAWWETVDAGQQLIDDYTGQRGRA